MPKKTAKKAKKVTKRPRRKPAVKRIGRARRVPDIKPGRYADGLPFNEVQYLECKIILRPNHFTSRKSFFDFARVMRRPAQEAGVEFSTLGFAEQPLQIREVLFLDTADFRLYNNAFILRRRIPYSDGFPVGDPEIVFKFRHPDIQKTAEMDVRPNIRGDFRIKFKAEVLPLKDRLGGMRLLFSHNVEFGLSALEEGDHSSLESIVQMVPVLKSLKRKAGENVELVGGTIVEEVLQDIGMLDFGSGITAVANVALWRSRGEHRPLIGEFAYQIKFKRREDLNDQALQRAEAFFLGLQYAAKDWIALGATKTGVVYRLRAIRPTPTSDTGAPDAAARGGRSLLERDCPPCEAIVKWPGLAQHDLLGVRFAINVFIASAILWYLLRHVADSNPIWSIASMVAASEPQVKEATRMFRSRIINVLIGCVVGLFFLLIGGANEWKLPLALAVAVLISSYVIHIQTMWRQAPITAAIVIASSLMHDSKLSGAEHDLHKVGEVLLGCLMGLCVSWVMSRIWPLRDVQATAT